VNLLRSRLKSGLNQPRKEAVHLTGKVDGWRVKPPSKMRDDGRTASDLKQGSRVRYAQQRSARSSSAAQVAKRNMEVVHAVQAVWPKPLNS